MSSRRLRETLREEGHAINRKRVQWASPPGPKPCGKPAPGHKVHPYLLRELVNIHKNAWLN